MPCGGANALSKPEPREGEVAGLRIALLLPPVGGGGNAVEAVVDMPPAGRELLGSALLKSNWSSNPASKERLFPAEVDDVLVSSPNALSKSLKADVVVGSEDAANGEVVPERALPSFDGASGKGLVLWASTVAAIFVTGGNVASTVVWGKACPLVTGASFVASALFDAEAVIGM